MKDKCLIALIVLTGLLVLGVTETSFAQQGLPGRRVLVGFKDGAGRPAAERRRTLVGGHGGRVRHAYRFLPAVAARLSEAQISRLRADPSVAYVEEDGKVYALGEQLPWGVDRIDAEIIHPNNKGAGVKVAIIDTGIDIDHPDLDVAGGHRYIDSGGIDDENYDDDNGHGTHCAGIVAALDNEIGVIGVAPLALIYAVKVLDSDGSGYLSDVVAGIQWAIDNQMDIISLSLGTNYDSQTLHAACSAADAAGILLVAAAGNDYRTRWGREWNTVDYPARYGSVIAVGAIDNTDEKASWSSTGPGLELVAPGVGIRSTYWNGTYETHSGTSMACPHVAGVAALVLAGEPGLTNDAVRVRLQETADDLGETGWDTWYGYGLVDADEAASAPTGSAPVAENDAYSVNEDSTLDVPALDGVLGNDSDPDGDPLTAVLVSDVSDGTLALNSNGSFSYAPDKDFSGTDVFTYVANDGTANSNTATVTITVEAVNDPPVAHSQSVTTEENSSVAITLSGSDADGDSLTYSIVAGPSSGTLSGAAPSVTYSPAANYAGPDSFSFVVNDGTVNSDSATVSIEVTPVNQLPLANAGWDQTADEGDTVDFDGSGSFDIDGTIVFYEWDFGDQTTGAGVTTSHVYADDGTHAVTLIVADDEGATGTDTATVIINNVAPTAEAGGPYGTELGWPVTLTGSATDPGATDILTYSWNFGDGSPTQTGQTVSHTYSATGTYTATLTVTDDDGGVGTDTTAVTISEAPETEGFPFTGTVSPGGESRHAVSVLGPATMYVKLTWSSPGDLRLRIYDPVGVMVAEVDESSWRNRVEEIMIDVGPGNWQVAAKSDSIRRPISYTIEGVVNY